MQKLIIYNTFLKLLELTIHKIYLSQRYIYLPVKYTARVVDYLTAKYPLMELARTRNI